MHEGIVKKAVSASSAFIPYFTPVEMDGRLLVDGGILSNVPVDATRKLGADFVIAVDLGSVPVSEDQLNVVSILWRTTDIMIRKMTDNETASADVLIRPEIDEFPIFDFKRCNELFQRGQVATQQAMSAIRNMLNLPHLKELPSEYPRP